MTLQHTLMESSQVHQVGGTTSVPNFLFDRVMPRLRDTEWRLLCVIVRQTFGWTSGDGERKKSDWLSHYQLKRRTGRSSAPVSRAIDTLVRAGLIVVRDSFGSELASSQSRRQAHCRLSFSISPESYSQDFQEKFSHVRFQISKSKNNKRNLYKIKQQHTRNSGLSTASSNEPDSTVENS